MRSCKLVRFPQVGRFDINYPKVSGHKGKVLDIAWNPFDDNQIASSSEDCTVKIWDIPDGGLKQTMFEAVMNLSGHLKKVCSVHNLFIPLLNVMSLSIPACLRWGRSCGTPVRPTCWLPVPTTPSSYLTQRLGSS